MNKLSNYLSSMFVMYAFDFTRGSCGDHTILRFSFCLVVLEMRENWVWWVERIQGWAGRSAAVRPYQAGGRSRVGLRLALLGYGSWKTPAGQSSVTTNSNQMTVNCQPSFALSTSIPNKNNFDFSHKYFVR